MVQGGQDFCGWKVVKTVDRSMLEAHYQWENTTDVGTKSVQWEEGFAVGDEGATHLSIKKNRSGNKGPIY